MQEKPVISGSSPFKYVQLKSTKPSSLSEEQVTRVSNIKNYKKGLRVLDRMKKRNEKMN